MSEESHIDAMREAIRGDLERARARRPTVFAPPAMTPKRPGDPEPAPPPEPLPAAVEPPFESPGPARFAFWRR